LIENIKSLQGEIASCLNIEERKLAKTLLCKLIEAKPYQLEDIFKIGLIYAQNNRLIEAEIIFESLLQLNSSNPKALFNLAIIRSIFGRHEDALELYERVICIEPNDIDSLVNKGSTLLDLGKYSESIDLCNYVLGIKEDIAIVWANKAMALNHLDRIEESIDAYKRAIDIDQNFYNAWSNLGIPLGRLGRYDEAKATYDRAININPSNTQAYFNKALLLQELDQYNEALAAYDKAIAINPEYVEAWESLGIMLAKLKMHSKAIIALKKALKIDPALDYLHGLLAHVDMSICFWDDLDEHLKHLEQGLNQGKCLVEPVASLAMMGNGQKQLKVAKLWAEGIPKSKNSYVRKSERKEKIHIGYISPDFGDHPVSYLTAGLFEQHNREDFEVIGISLRSKGMESEYGRRIMNSFDRFYEVHNQNNEQLLSFMRELELDIAIDLCGYTRNNKSYVFASRIAPIQINYLGHPGTMGADFMDYIIADNIVIPASSRKDYAEKIVYMPHSFQANDSKRKISDRVFHKSELGLPLQGFIYCCFNNSYKITADTLDLWVNILNQVEGSVLWLLAED